MEAQRALILSSRLCRKPRRFGEGVEELGTAIRIARIVDRRDTEKDVVRS